MKTDCTCTTPGFCKRHGIEKSAHWVHLCQTEKSYFDAWEKGRGPGQQRSLSPKQIQLNRLEGLINKSGCNGCGDSKVNESNESLLQEILNSNGVGSQLWRIFARLGIEHKPDCPCLLLADIMNSLSIDGCEENKTKIVKLLLKNQKKYGWQDYLRAGTKAVVLGWAFKINPLDPLPDLFDMAIALAKEQEQCLSGHVE